MNEKIDPIEQEIRQSISNDAQWVINKLDQRMAARLKPSLSPTRKSRFFWFPSFIPASMQPVLAIGVLILAIGISFIAGRQTISFLSGPLTLENESPTLVTTSEMPEFPSIYNTLTGRETLDSWFQSFAAENSASESASAASRAPAIAQSATSDSTTDAENEEVAASDAAGDDVQAAEPVATEIAQTSTLTRNNASTMEPQAGFTTQDLLLSGLMVNQAAPLTKASSGTDTIQPLEEGFATQAENMFRASVERLLASQIFQKPKGVAIDASESVYVTEYQPDGALMVLDDEGQSVVIRTGLVYPAGIAFGPDKSLYLAEQGRGRVLKFAPEDGRITPNSRVEVFSTGFSGILETHSLENLTPRGGPFALTITPANKLLVSDFVEGKTVIYSFDLEESGNWWDWLFNRP